MPLGKKHTVFFLGCSDRRAPLGTRGEQEMERTWYALAATLRRSHTPYQHGPTLNATK